jgi:hypothetical protein
MEPARSEGRTCHDLTHRESSAWKPLATGVRTGADANDVPVVSSGEATKAARNPSRVTRSRGGGDFGSRFD